MYELIKKLCAKKGISPTKLCTDITGSKGNLPTWQKGNINPVSLIKIADFFEVSTDYLLGRTDDPTGTSGGYSISTGDITGDNSSHSDTSVKISDNQPEQLDETVSELLTIFKNLDFCDKVKVMSLVAELSQK